MNTSTWIEIFGYLGSTLVVVSMLMSSVVKLRVINAIGSVISATYAFIIGSFPLALMNVCLIVINLYNLRKLLATRQTYALIKCGVGDGFLAWFRAHYAQDMAQYFPEGAQAADTAYLVLCNADPAGILLAKRAGEGTLEALVEYTTPTYRDCSVGKFLYSALPGEGVKTLRVEKVSEKHQPYLEKMGYTRQNDGFVKTL